MDLRAAQHSDLDLLAAWGEYALIRKQGERLIGMASISVLGHIATLGYFLEKASWGNGYATEAVTLLANWALAREDVYRVTAVCDGENPASARVMEKAGMAREGILRRSCVHPNVSDEPRDVFIYAKVK